MRLPKFRENDLFFIRQTITACKFNGSSDFEELVEPPISSLFRNSCIYDCHFYPFQKSPRQSRRERLSPSDLSNKLTSSSPVDAGIVRDLEPSATGDLPGSLFLLDVNCGEQSEREYLGRIWARLGVGKDGFLDRDELGAVCECVGREKFPKEVRYFTWEVAR